MQRRTTAFGDERREDGKIWFPTLEGVAIVDPNALEINPLPPPVEIESVAVDRRKC